MSNQLKSIIQEIASNANKGRWYLNEAPQNDENEENPMETDGEDPLAIGDEDPMGGGADDLSGSSDMEADGLGGDMGQDPESEKIDAEGEKAEADAEKAKAEADAAKAKADKEKSEAERERAEAEANEFSGIRLFSRPGTAFLVGQLLDDYSEENKVDQLAQQFVTKLKMDDEGFQKFKADSGPLLKLQGFQQLINSMENILQTSTDQDVEDATENS